MFSRRHFTCGAGTLALSACLNSNPIPEATPKPSSKPSLGEVTVESFDAACEGVIDLTQTGELLATGHDWLEGPAWDSKRKALYYTDVPKNIAYKWTQRSGEKILLDPSGVSVAHAQGLREPGANGLLMGRDGRLIICNHGTRAVERMDIDTLKRETLIGAYKGKKFNSPNDIIEAVDGTLYFTDPPYGLDGLNDSPLKDMKVNGVYKVTPQGQLSRIFDDMTFPNGIALSPDGAWLYVTQSDLQAPIIRRLNLRERSAKPEVWFDAQPYMQDGPGLPDGLAVAENGTIFVTGPGGVLFLQPDGKLLGRINTGRATANCAFGEDGFTLFITAQDRLLRVLVKIRGVVAG